MATKLFLRDSASELTIGAAVNKILRLEQGSSLVASDATATVTGPTSGVQVKKGGTVVTWFSNPLAAVTVSGTITFNVWGLESAAQANTGWDVLIERCDQNGNVLSTILRSEHGTELGTSAAVRNWTGTPTSTALSLGDRIKVTVFGNDAGGNMGNGRTFTLDYAAGSGVDGDSYVQFNETITEAPKAADTGAGTDTAAAAASQSASDSAAGADAAIATAQPTASEQGAGADTVSSIAIPSAADTGAGTHAISSCAGISQSDTGAGMEAANAGAQLEAAEQGAGVGAITSIDASAPVGEVSAGSENITSSAEITASEVVAGIEAANTVAQIGAVMAGAGADAIASIDASASVGEVGAGSDAVVVTTSQQEEKGTVSVTLTAPTCVVGVAFVCTAGIDNSAAHAALDEELLASLTQSEKAATIQLTER
jgi:hypothetical protein